MAGVRVPHHLTTCAFSRDVGQRNLRISHGRLQDTTYQEQRGAINASASRLHLAIPRDNVQPRIVKLLVRMHFRRALRGAWCREV
jgi:hypothetical protein